MLDKRAIEKNKLMAKPYKGLSYRADRDVFVVMVRVDTDVNGKPVYFKPVKTFSDFNEAVEWWQEVQGLVTRGILDQKTLTIRKLAEKYCKQKRISENTKQIVQQILNRLEKYQILDENIEKLNAGIFRKIFDDMQGYSIATKRNTKALLTAILRLKDGTLNNFEVDFGSRLLGKIRIYDNKNKENIIKPYTFNEMGKLVSTIKREGNYRNYLIIKTLICTGARISEVLGIEPCNIKATSIEINGQRSIFSGEKVRTKTKNVRQIPISAEFYGELKQYIEMNGIKGYLFDVTKSTITDVLTRLEHRAGVKHIEGVTAHRFRHTLISYFKSKGINIRYYVGHVDKNKMDVDEKIYTHSTDLSEKIFREQIEIYWNDIVFGTRNFFN